MTEQRRTALKELQKLDLQIQEARQRIHDFDPLFEEVEEPALILESDLGTNRTRLKEMQLEERRLELATEEKREREKRLDERVSSVRNLREEAAVSAELEMVKRGLQNDEQEALHLMDQIRKVEERLTELETAFEEANALVEPKRKELLDQRAAAKAELESFEGERIKFAEGMPATELKIYEAIRAGRRVAVAELTEDGACGHCFGVIPLQLQNEIRHGDTLIRCEGCGVILAAPEPVPEGADEPPPVEAEAVVADEDTEDDVNEAEAGADTEDDVDDAEAGADASAETESEEAAEPAPEPKRVPEPAAAAAAAENDRKGSAEDE